MAIIHNATYIIIIINSMHVVLYLFYQQVYQGNYDDTFPVRVELELRTVRYVRFHPRSYSARQTLRVELHGTPIGTFVLTK